MTKLDRIAYFLAGFLVALMAIAADFGSDHCQAVVLKDIAAHQKFEAELMQKVNPDFLTVLGGKK